MSTNQISPRARTPLSPATFDALLERPLQALPERVRPAAFNLWACNRHLKDFESPLTIAAPLAIWIEHFGLTEADAQKVLTDMLSPKCMKGYEFTSDLVTDLAERAQECIDPGGRKDREEQSRKREEEMKRNREIIMAGK